MWLGAGKFGKHRAFRSFLIPREPVPLNQFRICPVVSQLLSGPVRTRLQVRFDVLACEVRAWETSSGSVLVALSKENPDYPDGAEPQDQGTQDDPL